MKSPENTRNKNFKYLVYTVVTAVWVFTTAYTLGQSIQDSVTRYNTSAGVLKSIQVLLSLPTLFIYLSVAFAFIAFTIYTKRIRESKESKGYKYLSRGLLITLCYFLVSSLVNLFQYRYSTGQALSNFIVVRNYINLILNIFIYLYFWQGSKLLVATLNSKTGLARNTKIAQLSIIALSIIYAFLVFHNPYRTTSANELIKPTYALSDALIAFTIIIPYFITWLFAALTMVNLYFYSQKVNGIVFKQLFSDLSRGFLFIISMTISLQLLSQFSDFLANTGLQGILLLISVIFLALVFAYLQFGLAARKLDKIELI